MSTSDAERLGSQVEANSSENINKILGLVIGDGRLKMREITSAVDISSERVNMLQPHLKFKKLRSLDEKR